MSFPLMSQSQTHAFDIEILIDGVGGYYTGSEYTALGNDARYRFCIETPSYATVTSAYKPFLLEPPKELALSAPQFGGIPELGALSFSIVDVDNFLTDLLRINSRPVAVLGTVLNASTVSVTVQDASNLTTGTLIWMGVECMRIDSIASNLLTVTRGFLNTTAVPHAYGEEIFSYVNFLRGQGVDLYATPKGLGVAYRAYLGRYSLESMSWDPATTAYTFEAGSKLQSIKRQVPVNNGFSGHIIGFENEDRGFLGRFRVELSSENAEFQSVWTTGYSRGYIKVGDDIFRVQSTMTDEEWYVTEGGIAGTVPPVRTDEGWEGLPRTGARFQQVFVSDPTTNDCSFRYADPADGTVPTSRTTGTWRKTDHWVDIILILLTSSANPDSDAVGTNYSASRGNWASLPAGFGAGIDISDIDIDSFLDVKARTASYRFPFFVYGDKKRSVAEIIESEFLKPIGAYLGYDRTTGSIRLVLPRIPLPRDSVHTVTSADILVRETSDGVYEPDWNLSFPLSSVIGRISFEAGPYAVPIEFNASSAMSQLVSDFTGESAPEVYRVPSVDPRQAEFLKSVMFARLFRTYRPKMQAELPVSLEAYSQMPGNIWSVDYPEAPNLRDGTRGLTGVLSEALEVGIVFDVTEDGDGFGAHVRSKLIAYTDSVNIRMIAGALYVQTYTSGNSFTCAANRFTATNARGELPQADYLAFSVGDEVMLYRLNGAQLSATVETIDGISGTTITLSGDFGGSLAAGHVVRFANFDDASTNQRNNYAAMASGLLEVASGVEAHVWGEP